MFLWALIKAISARENHPTCAVEMTPFASKNGNLFGCHEDPHTTFFCTPHDAGVVKDAKF